jgi:hypothetical protein
MYHCHDDAVNSVCLQLQSIPCLHYAFQIPALSVLLIGACSSTMKLPNRHLRRTPQGRMSAHAINTVDTAGVKCSFLFDTFTT